MAGRASRVMLERSSSDLAFVEDGLADGRAMIGNLER